MKFDGRSWLFALPLLAALLRALMLLCCCYVLCCCSAVLLRALIAIGWKNEVVLEDSPRDPNCREVSYS
jgi:hypothetical protein